MIQELIEIHTPGQPGKPGYSVLVLKSLGLILHISNHFRSKVFNAWFSCDCPSKPATAVPERQRNKETMFLCGGYTQ